MKNTSMTLKSDVKNKQKNIIDNLHISSSIPFSMPFLPMPIPIPVPVHSKTSTKSHIHNTLDNLGMRSHLHSLPSHSHKFIQKKVLYTYLLNL